MGSSGKTWQPGFVRGAGAALGGMVYNLGGQQGEDQKPVGDVVRYDPEGDEFAVVDGVSLGPALVPDGLAIPVNPADFPSCP